MFWSCADDSSHSKSISGTRHYIQFGRTTLILCFDRLPHILVFTMCQYCTHSLCVSDFSTWGVVETILNKRKFSSENAEPCSMSSWKDTLSCNCTCNKFCTEIWQLLHCRARIVPGFQFPPLCDALPTGHDITTPRRPCFYAGNRSSSQQHVWFLP